MTRNSHAFFICENFMENLISIIIPNYNGEKLLEECLDSLDNQTFKDFETIVVDDKSNDSSLEILKQRNVKVIVNAHNLGFAGTVNKGMRIATGKYILLLNNDVVLASDFLERIIVPIEENRNVFSVSSKMIRYRERDTIDDAGDEYTVFGWIYKRGDGDSAYYYSEPDAVFSACAGAGLYRKEYLSQTGLLDELHYAYLEDVDLGWRARILGYENVYEPSAVCFHIGSATLADGNKYSDRKVSLSARNNIYIIYKNMPLLQLALNMPTLLLGFSIKAVYFAQKGFGKEYLDGLKEGLSTMRKLERFPFKKKNIKNYCKIQKLMVKSSYHYVVNKSLNFAAKMIDKVFGESDIEVVEG